MMKFFKIALLAMGAMTLVGCMGANASTLEGRVSNPYFSENYDVPEEHFLELVGFDVIEEILTDGDGVVLFSIPNCPWCQDAVPILNEAASQMDELIYYYDPKEDRESENDAYGFIMEALEEKLTEVDGKKRLLVPHVFFIKEGEIIADHFATFDGYDPREEDLTEEQRKQLLEIYIEGFEKMN